MAIPRFQLVPARVTDPDSGVTQWVRASEATGPVIWRLLGANNRELGRSPVGYADAAACERSLAHLAEALGGSVAGVVPVADGFGWRWQVVAGDEVLASSVKVLAHERDARQGLAQFLAAVPDALVLWTSNHHWEPVQPRHSPEAETYDSSLPIAHYGGSA